MPSAETVARRATVHKALGLLKEGAGRRCRLGAGLGETLRGGTGELSLGTVLLDDAALCDQSLVVHVLAAVCRAAAPATHLVA